MKLKTLKDIDWETENKMCVVQVAKLRIEAIKHYNRAKELRDFEIMWWIKHFFNITEEDLK